MGGDPKAGQPSARTVLSQPPWHAWWSGVLDEHTAFHPFRRLVSGSVNTDFCDGGLILKGSPRSVSSKYSHPFSFNAVIFVEWNVNGVRVTFVASFQQGRKPPTFLFNFAVWSRLIKKRVRDTHINCSYSPSDQQSPKGEIETAFMPLEHGSAAKLLGLESRILAGSLAGSALACCGAPTGFAVQPPSELACQSLLRRRFRKALEVYEEMTKQAGCPREVR